MVNLTPYVSDAEIKAVAALSETARADLAARIKSTDPRYLFDSVEKNENQVVCPFCGSGTHGNKNTGVEPKFENGVWLFHCFAGKDCEGTLIDIIAKANNISTRGKDFFQVLAIAAKILGINIYSPTDETQFKKTARNFQNTPPAAPITPTKEKIELPEWFSQAKKDLISFVENQGGFWRGVPLEIWQMANCGFLPAVYFPDAQKELPAVVIPNDLNGLYFRSIEGKFHKNNKPTATTTIYLPDSDTLDLLILEGQINGLSILTAIPAPTFAIIASSGTSGDKNILAKLHQLQADGKKIRVILAGDNDTNNAGQKFNSRMLETLKKNNIPACSVDITKIADIDLNNVLKQDNGKTKLAEMINNAMALAQVELEKAAAEMEKDSALKEKIDDWTKRNGKIENLDEIKAAADYLQSFTVDKITSTVASESKTIQALAKCKYYDFYQQVADDFLARVLSAKDAAKEKVKNDVELTIDRKSTRLNSSHT